MQAIIGSWYLATFNGGRIELVRCVDGFVLKHQGKRFTLKLQSDDWWVADGLRVKLSGGMLLLQKRKLGMWARQTYACRRQLDATKVYFQLRLEMVLDLLKHPDAQRKLNRSITLSSFDNANGLALGSNSSDSLSDKLSVDSDLESHGSIMSLGLPGLSSTVNQNINLSSFENVPGLVLESKTSDSPADLLSADLDLESHGSILSSLSDELSASSDLESHGSFESWLTDELSADSDLSARIDSMLSLRLPRVLPRVSRVKIGQ